VPKAEVKRCERDEERENGAKKRERKRVSRKGQEK
jgi:hypothetical protein